MKDIPVFSCPDGIATLILREVPFRGEGYILVRGVFGTLEGLLAECAGFCRAAGAERLFAAGEADFSGYPAAIRILAGGEALWICDGAERIGLGRVRGGELLAVAALQPGAGERCVRALAAQCTGPEVRLTCAEENGRAMRLYDRLGFSHGAEERVGFSI